MYVLIRHMSNEKTMATSKESNKREDHKARSSSAKADLIRTIERKRLRALVEANMDIAHQLHADDFQLINPAGGSYSKDRFIRL